MKTIFKQILPDAICVLLFVVIASAYFFSPVMDGKRLLGHDNTANDPLRVEIDAYRQTHGGETPRWVNSIFSGMPTYQIAPSYDSSRPLSLVEGAWHLWLPDYIWYIFASMLGFYLLLRAFDFRQAMAALGAIVWAFSSYFFIIIAAGHIWKVITLAYIPPTIAGLVWLYRGKSWRGLIVLTIFAALQIAGNHVQMTYYFLPVCMAVVAANLVESIKGHTMPRFWRASALTVVAALLAVAINISNLYHTYEYSKDTMRGKSELVKAGDSAANQTDSGLERDYITAWSYGIDETWTLLIPDVKGGASVPLAMSKTAMRKADPQFTSAGIYNAFTQYWGEQPMTSGPVYVGAIVCMLFLLALIIIPNNSALKWALLACTLLSFMLAWGRNFMPLTDWFIDHVPMYAKFRTVASILVIAEFTIPLLALLGLRQLLTEAADPERRSHAMKALGWSTGITVVLCLAFALVPTIAGDGISTSDRAAITQYTSAGYFDAYTAQRILASIATMRAAMVSADAWRSILFIMLGAATVYWMIKKTTDSKTKSTTPSARIIPIATLILLCLVDMWQVNKRYLNDDMFQTPPKATSIPAPGAAQNHILTRSGTARNYRVADLSVSTFNDNSAAYYFASIGGYHAAKLRRYQELVEQCISPEINAFYDALSAGQEPATDSIMPVLNMLNTRWFILGGRDGSQIPLENPSAYGNAWFVDNILPVSTANEELDALHTVSPLTTAIVNTSDFPAASSLNLTAPDSAGATIRQTSLTPNAVAYETENKRDGLAVFSEIYYPGWTATIDGTPVDILRADYVLRALPIPAGHHTVTMTFDPSSVHTTDLIAYIAYTLLLLIIIAALLVQLKSVRRN